MDVFDLRRRIFDDYGTFARSVARIKAEDPRHVNARYGGGQFWPEPLLQISPHFRPRASVDELSGRATSSRRPPESSAFPVRPRRDCAFTRIEQVSSDD